MKVAIFDVITFSGLFLAASGSRRFVYFTELRSFADARLRCQQDHMELAVVRNAQDQAELIQALGGSNPTWIGLKADTESWRWSGAESQNGQTGEPQSAGVEFTNWRNGEPSGAYYMSCAAVMTDGTWIESDCKLLDRFMCEKDVGLHRINRFVPGNAISDWANAQSHCRNHYRDLAVLKTPVEIMDAQMMMSSQTFWIGLFRDSWIWADGSPLTFENWASNYPTGSSLSACAHVSSNGEWMNGDCDSHLPFVCHSDESSTRVNVVELVLKKTDPSVGLEELDILRQLNQTLSERGLTGVTLKWREQPNGKVFRKKKEKEEQGSAKKSDCDFV